MKDRNAVSTLKGYFYQFDFSILQLLSLASMTDKVTIEGIEDVDITTIDNKLAIQCKYYEGTEYNHSEISEAIKFLLMDFAERKNSGSKKIKYMLYGYYSNGQEKLPDVIDVSFLKSKFLTHKRKEKNTDKFVIVKEYELLELTDKDLEEFLELVKIDINAKNNSRYMINDGSYKLPSDRKTEETSGIELTEEERIKKYFQKELKFYPIKAQNITKGDYNDGTLDKFSVRLRAKVTDKRLDFLFGKKTKEITFEEVLKQLMGYGNEEKTNVTIIDLSSVPFEVLSITVSLISRLIFEYGYYYKRYRCNIDKDENINNDIPFLLVYEEAHKYVPKSELTKYRSSQKAIERIAKEGRKYGITLMLASQRPSEISETIFSQCNNFIAMRLTNPNDQGYVKRLLPDTLGNLIEKLPSLSAGEALLIGEAIVMPSVVRIDECKDSKPSSNDIPYWHLWKEEWKPLDFEQLRKEWHQ